MGDKGWVTAIEKVLAQSTEPMHYKEIAEQISEQKLRKKLGATPAQTVAARLIATIAEGPEKSPFIKVSRGVFALRNHPKHLPNDVAAPAEQLSEGLIQSFGMFWRTAEVDWKTKPQLLGQQQKGSDMVDFCDQIGVYILHDHNRILYVGRSMERPLGQRLFEHTSDRLAGRWDRFSWFGLKGVDDDGKLIDVPLPSNDPLAIITAFESLLIEALEPPQNRKRGDGMGAVEFNQADNPNKSKRKKKIIEEMIQSMDF